MQRNKDGSISKKRPGWLTDKGNKELAIPEAQKSILEVYRLHDKGLGDPAIAKKMRATAPWKWKWTKNGIWQVIGEYQQYSKIEASKQKLVNPSNAGPTCLPGRWACTNECKPN